MFQLPLSDFGVVLIEWFIEEMISLLNVLGVASLSLLVRVVLRATQSVTLIAI
jgi:hypothetical protein